MRAGKLDRTVIIERSSASIDSYGVPSTTWATFATLRARVATSSTNEVMQGFGASTEAQLIVRTRFIDGPTVADRIDVGGEKYNIVGIVEIGRRRGLEIRAQRIGP